MANTTMWIIVYHINPLCHRSLLIYYVLKHLPIEGKQGYWEWNSKAKDTTLIQDDSYMEPICSMLLYAIRVNAVNGSVGIITFIPVIMELESPNYVRVAMMVASILYLLLGFMGSYCWSSGLEDSKGICASFMGWIKVSWMLNLLSCGTYFSTSNLINYKTVNFSLHDARLLLLCPCISMHLTLLKGYFAA